MSCERVEIPMIDGNTLIKYKYTNDKGETTTTKYLKRKRAENKKNKKLIEYFDNINALDIVENREMSKFYNGESFKLEVPKINNKIISYPTFTKYMKEAANKQRYKRLNEIRKYLLNNEFHFHPNVPESIYACVYKIWNDEQKRNEKINQIMEQEEERAKDAGITEEHKKVFDNFNNRILNGELVYKDDGKIDIDEEIINALN